MVKSLGARPKSRPATREAMVRKISNTEQSLRQIDCQISSVAEAIDRLTILFADELPKLTMTIQDVVRSLDTIERGILSIDAGFLDVVKSLDTIERGI
jgi:replication-associated recombination protein RarA